MFWCVVSGSAPGPSAPWRGGRSYERATGKSLVPSSFYDRFTPGLARMFRAVLAQLMRKLASSDVRYGGVLEGFRDAWLPMRGGQGASAVGAALSRHAHQFRAGSGEASPGDERARDGCAQARKVTGERAKDRRTLQMGPWPRGAVVALRPRLLSIPTLCMTETADTSLPAWPPTPTPASWPFRSVARARHRPRGQAAQRGGQPIAARPMSRSRWRSSVASTPVPDVPFAVVPWSRFASPRAPSIGSTSPTSTPGARCPVRCSDLRGSLASN